MRKVIKPLLFTVCLLLLACEEVNMNKPRGSKAIPEQIKVREVSNKAGRSIIYYDLPDDSNFKYVKAVFSPRPGEQSEVRASYFTDSLVLDGFKSEGDYQVSVYSVSYGETCSDPVNLTVSPLTPNYLLVNQTASFVAGFGGFSCRADNPDKEKLFITIDKYNEESGTWENLIETLEDSEKISITQRGLDPVPTQVRIRMEDLFGNVSDYVETTVTPLYEIKLDKTMWKSILTSGERTLPHFNNCVITKAWNENTMEDPGFQTTRAMVFPETFTIDLGGVFQLSRLEEWTCYRSSTGYTQRYEKYFNGHDVKDFEVYGASELDLANPLYDDAGNLNPVWTLLYSGGVRRDSGSANNNTVEPITESEEYKYANRIPRQFDFDQDAPPVRYVKFRILNTYGNITSFCIAELSLYGAEVMI